MLIQNSNTKLRRVVVLGLDGYPHSLLLERMQRRSGSIWHKLLAEGSLYRTRSSRPEVSSVAWASYLTGAQPGEHGLFGFVDRTLSPFRLYFPNGAHLKLPTLPERVHEAGGVVVSINVPTTFPPKSLNGLIVGGFLGLTLAKNVQPVSWLERLQKHGYIIDTDPALAHSDLEAFYRALEQALEARINAAWDAANAFDWNLLQLHIMETDRLFHFFWGRDDWSDRFHVLLDKVDNAVERFATLAEQQGAELVILSDHGFTRNKRIFFINAFLRAQGYLGFEGARPGMETLSPATRAYALVPGRVFINLRGREPNGTVSPGADYEQERDRLIGLLRGVRDPLDQAPVFSKVVRREDIYSGPYVDQAADVLAFPNDGYDIKADFGATELFQTPGVLVGTHTYGNAFCYVRNEHFPTASSRATLPDHTSQMIPDSKQSDQTSIQPDHTPDSKQSGQAALLSEGFPTASSRAKLHIWKNDEANIADVGVLVRRFLRL